MPLRLTGTDARCLNLAGSRTAPLAVEPLGRGRAALLVVGYGCYHAASSAGYLSAMGTVETSVGFVSSLAFMIANCAAGIVAPTLVALCAAHFARRPNRMLSGMGHVLLLVAVLVGAFPLSVAPDGVRVALGVMRGVGASLAAIAWVALYVAHARERLLPLFLTMFALDGALGIVLGALPPGAVRGAAVGALLAVSCGCALALPSSPRSRPSSRPRSRATGRAVRDLLADASVRRLASAWLCFLVAHFIVGLVNTAVFTSGLTAALASVNVSLAILGATVLVAVASLPAHRAPNPEATFVVAMPIMLVVFTLMSFMTDRLGAVAGYAVVGSYEAMAMCFSIFFVAFLRDGEHDVYLCDGIMAAVSNATLLLGLVMGAWLNALCSRSGVPLLTLLAFAAIYPVGIALLLLQRSRIRDRERVERERLVSEMREEQARHVDEAVRQSTRVLRERGVDAFASRHGLTRRETQVCDLLTRGYTAKSVAETLGVTDNTAWTHIRSVYLKCGVSGRQALIGAFEGFMGDDGAPTTSDGPAVLGASSKRGTSGDADGGAPR